MLRHLIRRASATAGPSQTQQQQARRALRLTAANLFLEDDKTLVKRKEGELMTSKEMFEDTAEKNRETFKNAIDLFNRRDVRKRGQVEFIRAALKNMKAFGVERDLEIYRALVDIMPKGKYVPTNRIQAGFKHFPKHQDCILDVLGQMYEYEVTPDEDMGQLLKNIFGRHTDPYKKWMRMYYWMNKQRNLSPWPLPFEVPKDTKELARMAVERITSVDRLTEVVEYDCEDVEDSIDKTWIISGQSPEQKEIIARLGKTNPTAKAEDEEDKRALYVEGAFRVWLKQAQVNYFILRGAPVPRPPPKEGDVDDVSKIRNWVIGDVHPQDLVKLPGVHEQEDATILACCATGTSSRDSLLSWIRLLEKENPALSELPVIFAQTSPLGPVVGFEGAETGLA